MHRLAFVRLDQGLQMLTLFKNHEAETTILEDFGFYEQREKAMVDIRQWQKQQYASSEAQKLMEAKEPSGPYDPNLSHLRAGCPAERNQGQGRQTKGRRCFSC